MNIEHSSRPERGARAGRCADGGDRAGGRADAAGGGRRVLGGHRHYRELQELRGRQGAPGLSFVSSKTGIGKV